jgi:hypothetical protein
MRDLVGRLEKQIKADSMSLSGSSGNQHEMASRTSVPVAEMQPDDVCQLLADLFIPADKIEKFIENGVCGKDLLDFSDEDLKGDDLQLTAIQVKKLRRELQKLLAPPQLMGEDGSVGMEGHDGQGGGGSIGMGMVGQGAMLAGGRTDPSVEAAYLHSQADVEKSLSILARNKEKGDPEQIVAALQECVYDYRVQVTLPCVKPEYLLSYAKHLIVHEHAVWEQCERGSLEGAGTALDWWEGRDRFKTNPGWLLLNMGLCACMLS